LSNIKQMWEIFKIPIITAITTIVLMYLVRWIESLIRNKRPLKITILTDGISFTNATKSTDYLEFFLPVNFTNRATSDYEISFSNFNIKPKKISDIEFSLFNRVFEEKWQKGTRESKFDMDRHSKSGYLLISMKLPKKCNWNEIYDILNDNIKTPFEAIFDYRLSTETKKKSFKQKSKSLMKLLAEKAYEYKRLYEE